MKFDNFRLSEELKNQLLLTQVECTLTWLNKDNWPVGIVQTYLWHDDAFWLTSFASRPRVNALRKRPQASVIVSSMGTQMGAEKMISCKALAAVHEDQKTKDWFYSAFAKKTQTTAESQQKFALALAAQERVIIELRPQSWLSFDGQLLRGNQQSEGRS